MNLVQLRMARAGLGWTQERLAEAADMSLFAYKGVEEGRWLGMDLYMTRLQDALERAGITFLDDDGSGFGVRRKGASGSEIWLGKLS
ncbi:hypothetical protein [uncultured Jannaschia sp.]|uniref:hypothetical protein n=1 Tax=uncultured Jannaschia sp. TaxID=293347 RepID=UPI00262BABEC|nr:hypothetical protein [uncultured Jannaschia sp.]